MNTIGFPNLGIGPFQINNTAFTLGPLTVRWYGIIIVIGMILGCTYAYYRMKNVGKTLDDLLDIMLVAIPVGIVGARLYYVVTTLDKFEYNSLYDVIAIWDGGIAIYGGIIFGAITVYVMTKIKKFNFLEIVDCLVPGVMIGQIIGRWGNFVNAEAYGSVETYEFFGNTFSSSAFAKNNPFIMMVNGVPAHPTFLYESVWNLIGFIIINAIWKKKKYHGEILLMYISWYGLGRCVIEGFRTDSLYVGGVRISQLVALLCFMFGISALVYLRIRISKNNK